jgi:hypothetical protein
VTGASNRHRGQRLLTGVGPSAQQPDALRASQLIVEDANGRARVVLGPLDAPPGTGDDRNRERINLVADEKGGAWIRFLDRRPSVVSRMYLDEQNRAWLSFTDFSQTPAMIRRYGLTGEDVLRPPVK